MANKIRNGARYRSRDGQITTPVLVDERQGVYCVFACLGDIPRRWNIDGFWERGKMNPMDLVEEVRETSSEAFTGWYRGRYGRTPNPAIDPHARASLEAWNAREGLLL